MLLVITREEREVSCVAPVFGSEGSIFLIGFTAPTHCWQTAARLPGSLSDDILAFCFMSSSLNPNTNEYNRHKVTSAKVFRNKPSSLYDTHITPPKKAT